MKRTLILACLVFIAARSVAGQSMQAVTSAPGPNLKIVVTWPLTNVSRFNLYRSPGSTASLNTVPIARMSSCSEIQAVIPMGSDDWRACAMQRQNGNGVFAAVAPLVG